MSITYLETSTLPPCLQSALEAAGVGRKTIGVYVQDTVSMLAPSGDGMRGFTILVDLDTGDRQEHQGSWGGANAFNPRNAVDLDTASRPLPPNGAVIHGHIGGGKPAYATITIHPNRAARLLPAPSDALSERDQTLLCVYARLNSRGRKEWFARNPSQVPTTLELTSLVEYGYITRNKSGAVTITAKGRNAAPSNDRCLY